MIVCSLVHIGLFTCICTFILIVGKPIGIKLKCSNMTRLHKHPFATGIFFCVIGDISKCLPCKFFVSCTTIQYANGHFQGSHLQFIILPRHSSINIKWNGNKNLVWFGNEFLVRFQICLTSIQILHIVQICGRFCKWIIVEIQPIFILPPWIRQQRDHIITRKFLPNGHFCVRVWQKCDVWCGIFLIHVVSFPELLHQLLSANEVLTSAKWFISSKVPSLFQVPSHDLLVSVQCCLFANQNMHYFDCTCFFSAQLDKVCICISNIFLELLSATFRTPYNIWIDWSWNCFLQVIIFTTDRRIFCSTCIIIGHLFGCGLCKHIKLVLLFVITWTIVPRKETQCIGFLFLF